MAAVSLAEFVAAFPEFAATDDNQATAALTVAESLTGSGWPDAVRPRAVMLQAAELLAAGPQGRPARATDPKGARSVYAIELDTLKAAQFCGVLRVG